MSYAGMARRGGGGLGGEEKGCGKNEQKFRRNNQIFLFSGEIGKRNSESIA